MRLLVFAIALLAAGCAVKPREVYRDAERDPGIPFSESEAQAVAKARSIIAKYPGEFYGFGLLADAFHYSTRFDSASVYYDRADSIFYAQSGKLDAFGQMDWIEDHSLIHFEQMLGRQLGNELLLGRKGRVLELLAAFENGFVFRTSGDTAMAYPENAVEYDLFRIQAEPCEGVKLRLAAAAARFEKLRTYRPGIAWDGHADIKAYLGFFELSGNTAFRDSAVALLKTRNTADNHVRYLNLRMLAAMGQVDSAQASLEADPALFAKYLRGRLGSLAEGAGFYGSKPCAL